MTSYIVALRLEEPDNGAVLERIEGFGLTEYEGVLSVSAQPEPLVVPPELQAPPPYRGTPAPTDGDG